MKTLPRDLQEVADHEPRLLQIDSALRSTAEGEQRWWRGLVDTANCYDPEEIASALRQKGLPEAVAESDAVWLRPARDGE